MLDTPKIAAAIAEIELPRRMRKLPISEKGFPIPAFVAWLAIDSDRYLPEWTNGARRDFRVVDPQYMDRCYRFSRCWLCGEPLGRYRVFAIGPMCVVNRITMEPPSHRDCAEYAVKACPFLTKPKMVRNEKGLPIESNMPGLGIMRNPGATALYQTSDYRRFRVDNGLLCRLGTPERIDWWAEGALATKAQVYDSIESGFPILMKQAQIDGPEAVADLRRMRAEATRWLPE
jgi:hypothetical protein